MRGLRRRRMQLVRTRISQSTRAVSRARCRRAARDRFLLSACSLLDRLSRLSDFCDSRTIKRTARKECMGANRSFGEWETR